MCGLYAVACTQRRGHVLRSCQPVRVGEGKLVMEGISRKFGTNNMCSFTI
jgi:hypothetical protein